MKQHYDVRWETGNDGKCRLIGTGDKVISIVSQGRYSTDDKSFWTYTAMPRGCRPITGVNQSATLAAAKRAAITRLMGSTVEL